eukprot:4863597-Lingulodinium_polyedra.AAC.1
MSAGRRRVKPSITGLCPLAGHLPGPRNLTQRTGLCPLAGHIPAPEKTNPKLRTSAVREATGARH